MSVSMRRVGALTLAGLAALGTLGAFDSRASAQFRPGSRIPNTVGIQSAMNTMRINPNFYLPSGISLNQAAYNTAVLGAAASTIPPYLLGYNPYPQVMNTGPVYPTVTPYVPPALTTGYSPYAGNPYYAGASLSAGSYGSGGGYGLSTTPGSYGGSGYGSGYGGYGIPPGPAGEAFGTAAIIGSTGDYYKKIMEARMTRERVKQMAIETRRRQLQEEIEWERMRPRAYDIVEKERGYDLAFARAGAPDVSVWSGRAMNDLLRSISKPGRKLNRGPGINLDDEALKNINLVDGNFKGQIALLRNAGRLNWPHSLQETKFDEARDRFSTKFKFAVGQLREREPLEPATIRDLRSYLKVLNDELANSHEELSPSQYIEARKYLNQLDAAVKALGDPKVANYFNEKWAAKGRTVAELVQNMQKDGLQFGPATPGEEAAYTALYQALRAFEAGVAQASAAPPRVKDE